MENREKFVCVFIRSDFENEDSVNRLFSMACYDDERAIIFMISAKSEKRS